MASKFLSNATTKIFFDDDEYIEFYYELSFEKQIELGNIENDVLSGLKRLFFLAKSWNLKNEKGVDVELNEENFSKLSPSIFSILLTELTKRINERVVSYELKKN